LKKYFFIRRQIYSDWHEKKALFTCSSTVKPKYMKIVQFLNI